MDLEELTKLIAIREYVSNARNNFSLSKNIGNQMGDYLILLDSKIVSILQSSDFKDYIEYKNLKELTLEVVKNNNIKSGLKK